MAERKANEKKRRARRKNKQRDETANEEEPNIKKDTEAWVRKDWIRGCEGPHQSQHGKKKKTEKASGEQNKTNAERPSKDKRSAETRREGAPGRKG